MPSLERIVFFGTPGMAVPTLDALCGVGRRPLLVVTQPARPAGRGQRLHQPPVARWALDAGLAIAQPSRVRSPDFLDTMRDLAPDLAVVVAFGQIFPRTLLEIPVAGCVNLHASLLPRHRGAAPVQAAIAAGDRVTGVTTMLMEEGLDTGPMLLTEEVEIGADETAGELIERLASIGGPLMVRTVEDLERGALEPRPQDDTLATYAPQLKREDGRIDWSLPAERIELRLRAYSPWPGSFTELRGETVKVLETTANAVDCAAGGPPGSFVRATDGGLAVCCGDGSILVLRRVQRAGRRAVSGADFANGMRLESGERFD